MAGRLTTHVLDTGIGRPAAGVSYSLFRLDDGLSGAATLLASGATDAQGRSAGAIVEGKDFIAGIYRLDFDVDAYLAAKNPANESPFWSQISIGFRVVDAREAYHIPLILSPFGYSTYRGS